MRKVGIDINEPGYSRKMRKHAFARVELKFIRVIVLVLNEFGSCTVQAGSLFLF